MVKILSLLIPFTILFGCCQKNNTINTSDGLVTSLSPLWSSKASNDENWNDGYEINTPVIDGGNVLVSTVFNKYQVFKMLNVQNGNTVWEFNDFFRKLTYDKVNYPIEYPLVNDHKMFWVSGTEIYNIDLTNGNTIWKTNSNDFFSYRCNGIGNNLLLPYRGNINDQGELPLGAELYICDKTTGKAQFLTRPKYDTTNVLANTGRNGNILSTAPFINPTGDTMLVVSFTDPPIKNYLWRDNFGVYNLSKRVWQIDKILVGPPTVTGLSFIPIIKDGKVFHCKHSHVTCHDIYTGELKWDFNFGDVDFSFSGILVQNGKVFANASDQIMHCIDIATGNELWKGEGSGTSSQMAYLNGIVYFVGGGDGFLHGMEEGTGKTIWKIRSPDIGVVINKVYPSFTRFCAVVPGINGAKGRIVTHTGYNIYCFEAAK